jgi:hypothetical protein
VKYDKHKFESEAALCDAFIAWAQKNGWTAYPETGGFDILLVNADGHQMGIEAKLTLNVKVIDQILEDGWEWYGKPGPNYRGILVPEVRNVSGLVKLLAFAGIEIFKPTLRYSWSDKPEFDFHDTRIYGTEFFDHNPQEPVELPEYIPDVRAGMSAPVQLTKWKVGALRLMAKLELQGYVTKQDCQNYRVDHRRFCAGDGWLKPLGEGKWGMGAVPRFDQQHPVIYEQIKAEIQEQLELLQPQQGVLA